MSKEETSMAINQVFTDLAGGNGLNVRYSFLECHRNHLAYPYS
jgi:hypothetical protein